MSRLVRFCLLSCICADARATDRAARAACVEQHLFEMLGRADAVPVPSPIDSYFAMRSRGQFAAAHAELARLEAGLVPAPGAVLEPLGGDHMTPVFKVRLVNGEVGIFKPKPHPSEAWANFADPAAEVAAYRLAKAIDWTVVPPTVFADIDGRAGSLQLFLPDLHPRRFDGNSDDRRIYVLHYLMNNLDTNPDNRPSDSAGRAFSIDHGLAFRADADREDGLLIHLQSSRTMVSREILADLQTVELGQVRAALETALTASQVHDVANRWEQLLRLMQREQTPPTAPNSGTPGLSKTPKAP